MPAHDPADRPVRGVKGPVLRDRIPKKPDGHDYNRAAYTEQSDVGNLWQATAFRAKVFLLTKE